MFKMLKTAGVALAFSVAAMAADAATVITGELSFSGLFVVPASDFSASGGVDVVEEAVFFPTGTGDFASATSVSLFDIDFAAPGTLLSLDNGISFAATEFTDIAASSFTALGVLSGGGFLDTVASFTLTAAQSPIFGGVFDGTAVVLTSTDSAVVPLPAAGFLLVGALGGLAVAGRRKAKKA